MVLEGEVQIQGSEGSLIGSASAALGAGQPISAAFLCSVGEAPGGSLGAS